MAGTNDRPLLGHAAPAIELQDTTRTPWRLADERGRPVVLVFRRHIHCLPCTAHINEIKQRQDEFNANTKIVIIAFTSDALASSFADDNELPFTVVVDRDRETYRNYGLDRAPVWRVYGISVMRRYAQLLRAQGVGALQRPTEDTMQRGGDFVVDPDGTLVYGHWSVGPADRPSVDDLIKATA